MREPNDPDLNDDSETVSKSQRKREMLALQDLGKALTEISPSLLEKCQLPGDLSAAIAEYKRLPNSHGAIRRQLQYIGRLMRDIDTTRIEEVLQQDQQQANLEKRRFHELEELSEKLLAGSEQTLQSLIADHPDLDIQHLRQLIRQAQKDAETGKTSGAGRKLFQYLRELKQDS